MAIIIPTKKRKRETEIRFYILGVYMYVCECVYM